MALNPLHELGYAPDHPTPVHVADNAARSVIEAALQSLIDLYGPAMLYESEQLRFYLEEKCPGAAAEIAPLVLALDDQVPQILLSVHSHEDLQNFLSRLAERLSDQHAVAPDASSWAVQTWARVLGLTSTASDALPASPSAEGDAAPAASQAMPGAATSRDAQRSTAPAQPEAIAKRSGWLAKPLNRWFAIGTALASMLVAAIVIGLASFHDRADVPAVASGVASIGEERKDELMVKSSPPLERTVQVSRAPVRPPVITGIDVPRGIVVGKPFALTIAFNPGAASLASIERKVIDSTVKWPSSVAVTQASELPSPKSGAVSYPFTAMNTPLHSTVEFTLVDGDGVRSQPRRIVLEVESPVVRFVPEAVAPPTRVVSEIVPAHAGIALEVQPAQARIAPPALPLRARIAPRVVSAPARVVSASCTRATCGSVVAVREIAAKVPGASLSGKPSGRVADRHPKNYEMIIRMDDRSIHTLTQATRWRTGARVRADGKKFVATNSRQSS